ncbi:MAG: T9SS type A sorting domain-containing protein [Bacteroidales bacterium]|nr:T9SS type A sorting domain-containing protein [Bacteroidales bacterium]
MLVLRFRLLKRADQQLKTEVLTTGIGCHASDNLGQPLVFNINIPVVFAQPDKVILGPNRPNPFSGETEIGYYLPVDAKVRMEIRDALGHLVFVLVDASKEAGHHVASFRCDQCPPGVYYYTIRTVDNRDGEALSKRMVIMR